MRAGFAGTPEFAARALAGTARRRLHDTAGADAARSSIRPRAAARAVAGQALRAGARTAASSSRRACAAPPSRSALLEVPARRARGCRLWPDTAAGRPRLAAAGCLNIHASLLPRWRGAAPIARAIEAGDAVTGITIMQMDAGLDTGPMIRRESMPVDAARHGRHAARAAGGRSAPRLIVDTLRRSSGNGALSMRRRSPATGATYAAKIARDGAVHRLDARSAHGARPARSARSRRRRAPTRGWRGTAFKHRRARRSLGAFDRRPRRAASLPSAATASTSPAAPRRTGRLRLTAVQPAGGRAMPAAAFARRARRRARRAASTPAWRKPDRCSDEQMQAARAVTRVLDGARLRDALADVDDGSALRGRTLVQELAYGTLRHWGTLDAIAAQLARKPIADPLLRSLVAVALYQLDHTRAPAFAVVDRAVFAAGELVRSARQGARQRAAAALPARAPAIARGGAAPTTSRDGRTRGGGSIACGATIRPTGRRYSPRATSGRRSTLRVNRRVTDRDGAARGVFAAAGIEAQPRGRRRRSSSPSRSPVTELPGFDEARSPCRISARSSRRRCSTSPTACACSTRARAPGGKTTHLLERADVDAHRARRRCRAARRASATTSRGCGSPIGVSPSSQGDAGAPDGVVGRPAVRPHPARRAVHGVGRRAPASRRQVAASRGGRRALRAASSRASLDAAWPLLGAGRQAALCDLLGVQGGERGSRRPNSRRAIPTRCAKPSPFPPMRVHRGGQLLPSPSGAGHNQDGFFYALLRKR